MKKVCLLLITLLVLTSFNQLAAQPYYFTHYQVENGLSNNTVMCSLQDKQGFLWFGTKDGLNRFDGYTFKVFRNDNRDANTIGNNVILCLHKDDKGVIWVGTERGIYQYDAVKERFNHLPCSGESDIHDIKTDGRGNLWFIKGFKLFRFNTATAQVQTFNHAGFEATSLLIIKGQLWVSSTMSQIDHYDEAKQAFTAYDVFKHSRPPTSRWIQKIYYGGHNNILIGTSNQGVKVFDIDTGGYKDLINYNANKTEIFVRDFINMDDDHIWIATESGIYNYNATSGSIELMSKQYNDPYALTDNAIYTFCKDHEGGIWIGTYFGGLNYYAKAYTYFEKYFPKAGENSLSGNAVREVCPDDYGNIWIGTEDGGLNRYSLQNGQFYNYQPLGSPDNVSASNIHGLLATGNQLLIGTFEHGLDVMDIKTKKVIHHCTVSADNPNLKSNFFYSIYKTQNGNIFTGTTKGLYQYHPDRYAFTVVSEVPADIFYTSVFEDRTKTIWAGTFRDGLYYYNPITKIKGVFKYHASDHASLSDNHINRLFEDSEHNLWIATENGLCCLNKDKKAFTRYTTINGLPSNIVYAMLEDAHQNLWITTSKGLVCMNVNNNHIKVFTKANGLLSDQFNYNSAYQDKNGNMYFGCLKGMIRFNPNRFINNAYIPPVYLTGFQINNKDLDIGKGQSPLKKSIIYTDSVALSYTQSSFSIDFAALGYTSPQMTAYAYKMDGLDKDWVYLNSNRKVYFTKLAPAKYTFEVRAASGNGAWSKNITRLTVIINPPFWLSKMAYLLYGLVTLFVIYVIVKNYRARTEKANRRKVELLENEMEKEIYHAKIAFFTHIAHEIRTPLTLIKGPMEKITGQNVSAATTQKNLKIVELNTNRLLNLATQLLDFRKTEIKGFSLNFVKANIVKLIQENIVVYQPSVQQKKISIQTHFTVKEFWAYVDIEALNKILSNLFNNAVKYADSLIAVHLTVSEDQFNVAIKNDGYLIPAEMKDKIFEPFFRIKEVEKISGTGIGLSLSRSLAELHKGTLELQFTEDTMNVFVLTLPVHHEIEFNLN